MAQVRGPSRPPPQHTKRRGKALRARNAVLSQQNRWQQKKSCRGFEFDQGRREAKIEAAGGVLLGKEGDARRHINFLRRNGELSYWRCGHACQKSNSINTAAALAERKNHTAGQVNHTLSIGKRTPYMPLCCRFLKRIFKSSKKLILLRK